MKKKLLITFLSVITCCVSFCQQASEFIEVVVQDTAALNPDNIVFSLVLFTNTGNPANAAGKNPAAINMEAKILAIIAAQKIDTLQAADYSIRGELYGREIRKKFLLHFTGARQLAVFISAIPHTENLMGFIVAKSSQQLDHYRQLLTKKLLEKAAADAGYIALQSKKEIIALTVIKEETNDKAAGVWTAYPPLSGLAAFEYGDEQVKIIVERKLRVKFSWH